MKFFVPVVTFTCLLHLGHCDNAEIIRQKSPHNAEKVLGRYDALRSNRRDRSIRGFRYPTRYSVGSIGAGNVGLSDYSYGKVADDFGVEGIEYDNGAENFVLKDLPRSPYGYGISKKFSDPRRLSTGLGLGIGSTHLNDDSLGYGHGYGHVVKPIVHFGGTGHVSGGVVSESQYKKGGGLAHESDHEAAVGAEDAKGYKVAEDYDKGEKGIVDKSQHSGKHSSAIGTKKGEEEAAKKYAEKETAAKGHKGENYSKSEGQKKGHKTSGFHNVYHKNEYKKDTTFYDDEHNHKQSEEYGGEHSEHAEADGAREKIETVDAAYHEAEQAKQGAFTNGHQYGAAQGHDRAEAEKEQYEKGAEYSKEAKHKEGKEHGSSSGSSFLKKIH